MIELSKLNTTQRHERKEMYKAKYDDLLDEIMECDEMIEVLQNQIKGYKREKNRLGKELKRVANIISNE